MAMYEKFYDVLQSYSAQKTRIKQFKRKSNKSALTKKQIDVIRKFYKPYKIPSMVFHRYFTEKTGEFHVNYIPQDLYVGYIDPYLNDIRAAKHLDNKCYYDSLFHSFKQPHMVLKRVNGIWLNNKSVPVDKVKMKELISKENEGIFIKEAEGTAGGHGVEYVDCCDDAYEKVLEIANKIKTDIVVQRRLKQLPEYASFNESSVNSLRIYSVLGKDGKVTIYSAVLRIGVGNTKVDNYASGGVSCGISSDGVLRKYAYNKKGDRMEKHPVSGIVFEGYVLPKYSDAVDLVKRAHPTIPHFRSVSWDIAISEDGEPILIEANLCRGGIDLLQLSNGPLFGEDTEKILQEVFISKKSEERYHDQL